MKFSFLEVIYKVCTVVEQHVLHTNDSEPFGGVGVGITGRCYAIPTMQGGIETIKPYIDQFIDFAKQNPNWKFLVTRIGCGIAGFTDADIAPLFTEALKLDNVYLPKSFFEELVSKP